MNFIKAHQALHSFRSAGKAKDLSRFFKTGKGEYGEGDRFLGIMVPTVRKLVKEFQGLALKDVIRLLSSRYNEERLFALLILNEQYKNADSAMKRKIVRIWLQNRRYVNNWNLVDASAPYVLGDFLLETDRSVLYKLVISRNLWDRRIAIVSTFALIRKNEFKDTIKLTTMLLHDEHDLIHKACGWMLREIGKRDPLVLEKFLLKNCTIMPRTMLRYAIERLPPQKRKFFLTQKTRGTSGRL